MPEGFGWVDHRLVRKGHLKARSTEALALYLFLVTVGDADGVSYYSRESLCDQLKFSVFEFERVHVELIEADLVAYKKPFYQVLDLPHTAEENDNFNKVLRNTQLSPRMPHSEKSESVSLGEVIKSMTGGK